MAWSIALRIEGKIEAGGELKATPGPGMDVTRPEPDVVTRGLVSGIGLASELIHES